MSNESATPGGWPAILSRTADSLCPGNTILDTGVVGRPKRRTVLDVYRPTKEYQPVYVCPGRIILRVSGSDTLWVMDAGQMVDTVR